MNAKDFERRIDSGNNKLVLTSDDYLLTISIGIGGRYSETCHLIPEKVDELKAAIADWERLYYGAAEDKDAGRD